MTDIERAVKRVELSSKMDNMSKALEDAESLGLFYKDQRDYYLKIALDLRIGGAKLRSEDGWKDAGKDL